MVEVADGDENRQPRVDLDEVIRSRPSRHLRRLPRLVGHALAVVWQAAPRRLVALSGLQVFEGLALVAQLLIARHVLSRLVEGDAGAFSALAPALFLLFGVVAMGAVAVLVRTEQQRLLGEQVGWYATNRVLEVASAVDLANYEEPEFTDRLQRAALNALSRPVQVSNALLGLLSGSVAVIGVCGALLALQPLFLAVVVVAYVPAWSIANRAGRLLHDFAVLQTERDRRRLYLFSVLSRREEAAEVRSYSLGRYLLGWHDRLYAERMTDLGRLVRRRLRLGVVGQLIAAMIVPSAVALLVWMISTGRTDVSSAAASAAALVVLAGRLSSLVGNAGQLYEAALFLEDFTAFVHEYQPAPAAAGGAPRVETPSGFDRLVARDVSFCYPSRDEPSLQGVSVTIASGEVVALVGENGSGKTTLAKLLAGLYTPDQGTITWDGVDIRTLDEERLRASIAVIFQDFARYRLTAGENITMGRHERFDDEVAMEVAARAAGAHDPISALPRGYRTRMGPQFLGGSDLSVGQWQRVALARAFFRDAPFVILDEPTASLDSRAERELFDNIRTIFAGRAVLVISHRFANVRAADRIYVLAEGRVVEEGGHERLMAAGGLYAELYAMQASMYRERA